VKTGSITNIAFQNLKERLGTAYPDSQPMRILSSIWNGDNWATSNGWVKLNWTCAPFVANYEKFSVDACVAWNGDGEHCMAAENQWWEETQYHSLASSDVDRLNWVKENYVVYNYCTDQSRNPTPPAECELNVL
jgi:xyloglucan:xyloglucosyl transferase